MSTGLPPNLLVPYLATAAHEVGNGTPLSARSRAAIADAIHQLRAQRTDIDRTRPTLDPTLDGRVALAPLASEPDTMKFATLVLRERRAAEGTLGDKPGTQSSDRLAAVIEDLEQMSTDGADTKPAALRVQATFDAILDQIAPSGPPRHALV